MVSFSVSYNSFFLFLVIEGGFCFIVVGLIGVVVLEYRDVVDCFVFVIIGSKSL